MCSEVKATMPTTNHYLPILSNSYLPLPFDRVFPTKGANLLAIDIVPEAMCPARWTAAQAKQRATQPALQAVHYCNSGKVKQALLKCSKNRQQGKYDAARRTHFGQFALRLTVNVMSLRESADRNEHATLTKRECLLYVLALQTVALWLYVSAGIKSEIHVL